MNMKESGRSEFRRAPRDPCRRAENYFLMSTSLVKELERMAEALEAGGSAPVEIPLASVAEKIAKELGVQTDEVAIMGVSTRWRHLYFLVPQALKNVGFVPLSSPSALAARTARRTRPEINNNFSAVRHATVFEGVKAATTTGESIQKIVSAPILCEGKVVGVMQISRKGATVSGGGTDFTAGGFGKEGGVFGGLGGMVGKMLGG